MKDLAGVMIIIVAIIILFLGGMVYQKNLIKERMLTIDKTCYSVEELEYILGE